MSVALEPVGSPVRHYRGPCPRCQRSSVPIRMDGTYIWHLRAGEWCENSNRRADERMRA